jgi:hypothetical protein
VTLPRAARLLAFGALLSLAMPAGPTAALLGLLAAVAMMAGGTRGAVIFRLPHWVFRALAVPAPRHMPTHAAIARAWWVQPQG